MENENSAIPSAQPVLSDQTVLQPPPLPKNNKRRLWIIVMIVLLLLVVGYVIYQYTFNSPQIVAADGLYNLTKLKTAKMDGNFTIIANEDTTQFSKLSGLSLTEQNSMRAVNPIKLSTSYNYQYDISDPANIKAETAIQYSTSVSSTPISSLTGAVDVVIVGNKTYFKIQNTPALDDFGLQKLRNQWVYKSSQTPIATSSPFATQYFSDFWQALQTYNFKKQLNTFASFTDLGKEIHNGQYDRHIQLFISHDNFNNILQKIKDSDQTANLSGADINQMLMVFNNATIDLWLDGGKNIQALQADFSLFNTDGSTIKIIITVNNINTNEPVKISEPQNALSNDDAIKASTNDITNNSDSDNFNQQGVILLRNGQYNQAKDIFLQAIAKDPSNYKAHYNLALVYEAMKDYGQAIKENFNALELNPNFAEAEVHITTEDHLSGQCQQGIHDAENFIKNNPASDYIMTVRWNLAYSYECINDYSSANNELQVIANTAPDDLNIILAYHDMGVNYEKEQNFKTACPNFQKSVDKMPQSTFLLDNNSRGQYDSDLAYCYYVIGQPDQAKKYFKLGLQYNAAYISNQGYARAVQQLGIK